MPNNFVSSILLLIKIGLCYSSSDHINEASADVLYKLYHGTDSTYGVGPIEIVPQQSNMEEESQEDIDQKVQMSIEEKLVSNRENESGNSDPIILSNEEADMLSRDESLDVIKPTVENNDIEAMRHDIDQNYPEIPQTQIDLNDNKNKTTKNIEKDDKPKVSHKNLKKEIASARILLPITSFFQSPDDDMYYSYDSSIYDTNSDVYEEIVEPESTEASSPVLTNTTHETTENITDSTENLELITKQEDLALIISRVEMSALETVSKENPDEILPYMRSNGSFSDVDYRKYNGLKEHARRMGALVYHFTKETDKPSLLLKNGEIMNLFHHINASFYYITYNVPRHAGGNWWHKVIGTPAYMWEAVFLARNVLPSQLIKDFLDEYWINSSEGPVWNPSAPGEQMTGGNLGPRVLLAEVEGLLRGPNLTYHHQIQDVLHDHLVLKKGWGENGIRADGCLHQHNIQGDKRTQQGYLNQTLGHIYNHQYGKEFLRHIARVMTWFSGTFLDFDESTVEGLYDAYLQCHQWLFRGHIVEPTSTGRFITSGYSVTKNAGEKGVLSTAELLYELGRHKEEIQSILHRYHNVQPYAQYALQGNRHFFCSDIMAHQRREFMATVRLLSNRTARPESWVVQKLNMNGYFQGDGFLSIVIDGKEFGEENSEVFQVYDWAKVPGVTNQYTTRFPKVKTSTYRSEHFYNNSTFVGGVSDGRMGLAVMDLARPTLPLRATKSWFFFDNVIVALGSGITLASAEEPTDAAPVITTLAQEVYQDSSYTIGLEGSKGLTLGLGHHKQHQPQWLHQHLTGYVFLHGDEELHIDVQNRDFNNQDNNTLPVFMAWLDHGPSPSLGSYAYAILPGALHAATRAFAENPNIVVLAHMQHLHAVCHLPSQTVGVMINQEELVTNRVTISSCGSWGNVEVEFNHPVLALITTQAANKPLHHLTLTITLADPNQIHETMVVTVKWSGRQLQRTISLPIYPYRGASVKTTFTV